MRLEIERTLGIERAAIDLEPGQIVEVVGPNASGKTSAGRLCAGGAGAGREPAGAVGGGRQAQLPARRRGRCVVVELTPAGCMAQQLTGIQHSWNAWKLTGTGNGSPISHPEAVGLVDFTAKRGAKERAAIFQNASAA